MTDAQITQKLFRGPKAKTYRRLWAGDLTAVDFADWGDAANILLSRIAYFAEDDVEQVCRIFGTSELAKQRQDWRSRVEATCDYFKREREEPQTVAAPVVEGEGWIAKYCRERIKGGGKLNTLVFDFARYVKALNPAEDHVQICTEFAKHLGLHPSEVIMEWDEVFPKVVFADGEGDFLRAVAHADRHPLPFSYLPEYTRFASIMHWLAYYNDGRCWLCGDKMLREFGFKDVKSIYNMKNRLLNIDKYIVLEDASYSYKEGKSQTYRWAGPVIELEQEVAA